MQIFWCDSKQYLDQMVDFQLKMAMETEKLALDPKTLRRGIETQISKSESGNYLLALEDSKLLGMLLTLYEWSDWRCRYVIWIHSVYVAKEYRNNGVFKQMYSFLKDSVNQDDTLAGLRLYVDKTNLAAQEVYKTIGMNDEHYALFEWMKS